MKNILILITLLFTGLIANAQSTDPALVGYWQNWWDPASPYIPLDQVDSRYNIIDVSFAIPKAGTDYNMQFIPDGVTQATFLSQIKTLQSKGKKVIISIGGATAPISLSNTTERDIFVSSMGTIIDTYGFDGIDIDFEGSSLSVSGGTIAAPVDQPVINLIYAVKQIMKNYYTKNNRRLMLTLAPETAFVQGGMSSYGGIWGAYLPVIHALRDSIEILHVQLYNSGTVYGIDGKIYSQGTADFIVAMTEAVIKGFNTNGGFFTGLPANKVAVGLPACSGASSGFVSAANVQKAINYLRGTGIRPGTYILAQAGGYPTLRGMMTWSINWDKLSTCGLSYEFAQNFQTIFGTPAASTTPTALATPAQPAVTNILANSATVSWAAVSGATSYKLRYKTSASTTYITLTSASTTYSLTGLTAGTSYDCSVQAVNSTTSSAFGATRVFTTVTPAAALAAPAQPVVTTILETTARASWVAVSGAASYNVRYKLSNVSTYTTVPVTTTAYNIPGLTGGKSYDCSVQAVNSAGSSAFGLTRTFITAPAVPAVSSITMQGATATWAPVSGATSYNLRYKVASSTTYKTFSVTGTSYTISGLIAGVSYDCSVQAVLASGSTGFSAAKRFITLPLSPCTAPAALAATNVTASTATLSWNAVASAPGYHIGYRPVGTTTWINKVPSVAYINVTSLLANTVYEMVVRTKCSSTTFSAYSPVVTFKTSGGQLRVIDTTGIQEEIAVGEMPVADNNTSSIFTEELSVEVYPNPTTDYINLRTNITMEASETVTLFNTAGQLLFTGNLSGQMLTIPVAELAPGIYFLKLRDRTSKFIKK